ncbi:MAG TPA: DUF1697 domain-containing protein [Actinomycetota bacterium]|nr:DUF1697 domain-containing protein [Actinomycetota bacterium]
MAAKRHVVLLRGVNLGKSKRIAMSDFRELLESLGFQDVRTHIVSGNAIVSGGLGSTASMERRIEEALLSKLGLDVTVLVRSAKELDATIAANPFAKKRADPKAMRAVFLSVDPKPAAVKAIAPDGSADRFAFGKRVIYLHLADGVAGSKLPNWEKLLGVRTTMRTWNVVNRLRDMAAGDA